MSQVVAQLTRSIMAADGTDSRNTVSPVNRAAFLREIITLTILHSGKRCRYENQLANGVRKQDKLINATPLTGPHIGEDDHARTNYTKDGPHPIDVHVGMRDNVLRLYDLDR